MQRERTVRRWHRPIVVGRSTDGRAAFTLLELLVVITILMVLMGIVLASLVKVRVAAKSFVCKNKLKTVAFEFFQFADDYAHPWRGDSEVGGRQDFQIEDFQERLYGISEFWRLGGVQAQPSQNGGPVTSELKTADHPLVCPSGPQQLERHAALPCRQQAVTPLNHVSIGFNKRLDQASVMINERWVLQNVRLTKRILAHPAVPLAFDVDGEASQQRLEPVLPYYGAPAAGDPGKYAEGRFWFPALRHGGQLNAAFVGGYILSSRQPEQQAGWDWKYQPPPQ